MLIRTDPFRELDRLAAQLQQSRSGPAMLPMDAWRDGDEFVVSLDLPGVDPDAIDVDVERNVVTVRAERRQPTEQELMIAERPQGPFQRQLVLGESLDTERIRAGYDAGVLMLRIPVAERSKPRRIEIASGATSRSLDAGASALGVHEAEAVESTSAA
jgi:HSP20 family protein